MKSEKPNIYTAEFRASAVKLANDSDKPITQIAKDLGINVNTLHTWISKYSRPKENDKTARTDEHLYDELKRLKKEVARLTEERDLLKNCLHRNPLAHLSRNTVSSYTILIWKVVERLLEILIPSKNLTQGVSGPSVGGQSDPV